MSADSERKKLEEQLKLCKVNTEIHDEVLKTVTQLFYRRYRYFIEAGFTKQQAFDLVKSRGLE